VKKKFTLIELIIVIAVLGVLAAIVIPNIQNIKNSAKLTSIYNNVKNIQTAVDMYALDHNGNYPTVSKPSELIPEPIDFTMLHTKYIRDYPDIDGIKYWVYFTGKVWDSTIDSPKNIRYVNNIITWERVEGVKQYQIYELEGYNGVIETATANNRKIKLIANVSETTFTDEEDKTYLVNVVDPIGLESAPVGKGM